MFLPKRPEMKNVMKKWSLRISRIDRCSRHEKMCLILTLNISRDVEVKKKRITQILSTKKRQCFATTTEQLNCLEGTVSKHMNATGTCTVGLICPQCTCEDWLDSVNKRCKDVVKCLFENARKCIARIATTIAVHNSKEEGCSWWSPAYWSRCHQIKIWKCWRSEHWTKQKCFCNWNVASGTRALVRLVFGSGCIVLETHLKTLQTM